MKEDYRIVTLENNPPQTPFAPTWKWCIGEKMIDSIDLDEFASLILSKEKYYIDNNPPGSDGNTLLGPDSLTSRFMYYNLLLWDEPIVKELHKQIRKFHNQYIKNVVGLMFRPPKLRVRCWANVLRKGEQIHKHLHSLHSWAYLGGHFTVKANGTATVYVAPNDHALEDELITRVDGKWVTSMGEQESHGTVYVANNRPGRLTLFPHPVPHYTTMQEEDTERITIAFDITPLDIMHNGALSSIMDERPDIRRELEKIPGAIRLPEL